MALRILSGLIIPRSGFRHSGSATIDFHPHSIGGDVVQPGGGDIEEVGPNEQFKSEPCKIVSLRRIRFADQDHSRRSQAVNVDNKDFNINDSFDRTRRNSLTVSWDTDGRGAEIREISYMIIGDAE